MARWTSFELRESAHAVRKAILKHHPIKISVANDAWAKALADRHWSSLMAEAAQKRRIEVRPSLTRFRQALEARRKPLTEYQAAAVIHAGLQAAQSDVREKPRAGQRETAMRRLAAYGISLLERDERFDWDKADEASDRDIDEQLRLPIDGGHLLIEWRGIGFEEFSVECHISAAPFPDNAYRVGHPIPKTLADCFFWIERKDGPFVQRLDTGRQFLHLSREGEGIIQRLPEVPDASGRRWRFSERVWM